MRAYISRAPTSCPLDTKRPRSSSNSGADRCLEHRVSNATGYQCMAKASDQVVRLENVQGGGARGGIVGIGFLLAVEGRAMDWLSRLDFCLHPVPINKRIVVIRVKKCTH